MNRHACVRTAVLLAFLLVTGAGAATYYWDDGTVTVNGASGGGTGAWTVGAAGWEDGALAQNWTDGNAAVFGGTAGTVTLGGNIAAGTLSFTHTTGTYTLVGDVALRTLSTSGVTIGAGGIAKLGNGTGTFGPVIILSGDITNNGTLALGGGRVRSDGTTARTISGAVNIDQGDGTSAAYLGDVTNNGKLTFSGTVTFTGTGRGFTTYSDVDITGGLAGAGGGFTKAGAGTLTMAYSVESSLSDSVTVSAGVLTIGSTARLYNSTSYNTSAIVTVNTGATLRLGSFAYGSVGGLGAISAYSNQRILNGGTIEVVGNSHSSACDFRVNNASSGTFRYTPTGQTLTLSDNVNDNIRLGGALTVDAIGNITVNELIQDNTGAGSIVKTGAGTLTLSNFGNTFTGSVTINSGILVATGVSGNTYTALGSAVGTRAVTVNSGGTLSFTSNNVFGGSAQTLANTPKVVVNSGGTMTISTYNVVGNVDLNGGTLTATGGSTASYHTYEFNGSTITVGGSSASTMSSSAPSNGGMHIAGGKTLICNVGDVTAGTDLTVSAALINGSNDRSGTGALTKTGAGTMELTAANTYTGATTVNGGTLLLSAGALASAVTVNSTGTFAVSGGTLTTTTTVNSGGQLQIRTGGGVGGAVNVASGGALVISGSGTLNNNAVIASGGTLDVSGATGGVYSLGASSTFTLGHTGAAFTDVVTGGTLATGGGALRLGVGAGTTATLTSAGGLTLNGGTVYFDLAGTPAGTSDRIDLAGTLDLSSSTVLNIHANETTLGNGSYSLVTYTALAGSVANVSLTGVVSGGRQAFALSTTTVPNTLTLDVTGVAAHLVWNDAAATGIWDTQAANTNWDHGGANDYFVTGDIVELADTAKATETLTIPGDVSPSSIQATHTAATAFALEGAGRITGATGLTATGGGTLTLANTGGNDFTGATQVSNGSTLIAGVANALSAASALTVTNGTVNVSVAGVAAGTVALQADGVIGGAGSLNASGITATGGTISAGLGGTGALSVPSGAVHLTGAAAHSGGTTVSSGAALTVNSGGSLGAVTVGGTLTLNTATLAGTATVQSGGALQIAGAATLAAVANSGTATISGADAVTLGGLLSGGGAWVKNGAGTTTVTGGLLHTQTGNITVNEGTLDIRDAVLYSGGYRTPFLTVGNGAGSTARLVVNNTQYNESATPSSLQNNLGGLTFNHDRFLLNGGTVVYAGTNASYVTDSRSFTIQAGGGTIEVEHAGTTVTFGLSAGSEWDDFMLGANTLTFTGPGNIILNNVIHDGSGGTATGGLAKTGNGTLTLGGANNFSGPVAIQSGLVKMTNAAGLGTVAGATVVSAGAALDLNGTTLNAEPVTLNGTGLADDGALINGSATEVAFSGPVTLASDAAIGGTGNYALSGAIGGPGGLTKVGANAVALTNASNTYGGATVVSNGVLAVTGNLPAGAVSVAAGATLAGTGTVGGAATVNGTLSPGTTTPGTLTFTQDLVLNSSAALAWKWADPNLDAVVVQGALTLDGTLTVADLTTVPEGTYTIITYTGALTDNGLAITDPGDGRTYTINTATAGQVKLVVSTVLTPYAQWWKDTYGIEPAPPEDGDYDGDGTPNGEEFAAKTNPTDNTSYLHLTNVAPAGNDMTVSVFTGGATYDLERTSDLLGSWTDIGDITGNDAIQDVTDPGAATGATWFYRAKVK